MSITNNNEESPYFISHIEGFAEGEVNKSKTQYIDTDGAEFSDVFFEPRIVTIDGYILAESEEEMIKLKRKLIQAYSPKEEHDLYYTNGAGQYYARALSDSLPKFGVRTRWALPFTLYLNIFGFYILSASNIKGMCLRLSAI